MFNFPISNLIFTLLTTITLGFLACILSKISLVSKHYPAMPVIVFLHFLHSLTDSSIISVIMKCILVNLLVYIHPGAVSNVKSAQRAWTHTEAKAKIKSCEH